IRGAIGTRSATASSRSRSSGLDIEGATGSSLAESALLAFGRRDCAGCARTHKPPKILRARSSDACRGRAGRRQCVGRSRRCLPRSTGLGCATLSFSAAHPTLQRVLAARSYVEPTAVQLAVLADDARDRDLLVSAQTGSGKTVAFGLAVAQ